MKELRKLWIWLYMQTEWRRFFGLNVSLIDPLLFVGGQFRPSQWTHLHNMGIRAVLSLQDEYEDRFVEPYPLHTLRLRVVDHRAPSLEQLEEAVQFIAEAHAQNLPVLVHCHAGVGRAPLTAAAYLIARRDMDATTAIRYIRVARPNISLNSQQRQRLMEWAAKVQRLQTASIDDTITLC